MLRLTERYPRKRAFITGAGSGLGAALAVELARDGWTIGMTDLREESLHAACETVRAAGGEPAPYVFDVTDRAAFKAAADEFLAAHDGVDLVVNNAGVAGGGALGDYTLEDWDWLYGINVMGVVHGCHFFVPAMKAQGSGHLINTASAAGFAPVPEMTAYCSAKAAVRMLSECLYNELYDDGVNVSVLMPEFFQTNLHETARGPRKEQASWLIKQSKLTAPEVAKIALEDAGDNVLHITVENKTKIAFRMSRWVPQYFYKLVRKQHKIRSEVFLRTQDAGAADTGA